MDSLSNIFDFRNSDLGIAVRVRYPALHEEFDAFHDGADERVTLRLVQWLERKGVTVLMSPNQKFVRSLADAMDRNATAIGRHTYRLEPRDS